MKRLLEFVRNISKMAEMFSEATNRISIKGDHLTFIPVADTMSILTDMRSILVYCRCAFFSQGQRSRPKIYSCEVFLDKTIIKILPSPVISHAF